MNIQIPVFPYFGHPDLALTFLNFSVVSVISMLLVIRQGGYL